MAVSTILRDAAEWIITHIDKVQRQLDAEDHENIQHIDSCPGCPRCAALMEFYSGCSVCQRTGHKDAMTFSPETGEYTCDSCVEDGWYMSPDQKPSPQV